VNLVPVRPERSEGSAPMRRVQARDSPVPSECFPRMACPSSLRATDLSAEEQRRRQGARQSGLVAAR